MAGSNNFLQFDPNLTNIIDDDTYLASSYRLNGAVSGIAPSNQHNKLFYQLSTMVAAIAQAYANHNIDISDANFAALVSTLEKGMLINFWKPSTAYTVGDVKYSASLPSWARLECTVAGTTATTEPIWPAVGNTIADGTATWIIRDIRDARKLQTPRTIALTGGVTGSVSFDGSANASITATVAALGAIDGSQLTGIVSSGTGWVKFSDGTQICKGGGAVDSNGTYWMNYAVGFYATPTLVATHRGLAAIIIYANSTYATALGAALIARVYNDTTPAAGAYIDYIAIGRWKA